MIDHTPCQTLIKPAIIDGVYILSIFEIEWHPEYFCLLCEAVPFCTLHFKGESTFTHASPCNNSL